MPTDRAQSRTLRHYLPSDACLLCHGALGAFQAECEHTVHIRLNPRGCARAPLYGIEPAALAACVPGFSCLVYRQKLALCALHVHLSHTRTVAGVMDPQPVRLLILLIPQLILFGGPCPLLAGGSVNARAHPIQHYASLLQSPCSINTPRDAHRALVRT